MRVGNCYLFALRQHCKFGGWIIVRKSIRTWVPHMQHTRSAAAVWDMERVSFLGGLRRIYGPLRGYMLTMGAGWWWAPSIEKCEIEEYLPPEWAAKLLRDHWIVRALPIIAIAFPGRPRRGMGETDEVRRALSTP